MLLLVSCWEGLICRPLTTCVFAGHRVVSRGSFHRSVSSVVSTPRFVGSFNNIGSSQFQVRSFKNVSFRFPQSYGDVRCDTLLPSYRDVRFDTSLQLFEYVQFVKTLPYSSCASSSSRRCRTVRVSSTSSRCSSVRLSSRRCIRLKTLLRGSGLLPTPFQYAWLGRTSGTTSIYEHSLSGFHYRQQTDDGH